MLFWHVPRCDAVPASILKACARSTFFAEASCCLAYALGCCSQSKNMTEPVMYFSVLLHNKPSAKSWYVCKCSTATSVIRYHSMEQTKAYAKVTPTIYPQVVPKWQKVVIFFQYWHVPNWVVQRQKDSMQTLSHRLTPSKSACARRGR